MKERRPQVTQVSSGTGNSQCRGARVAFFGGSFDPPHLGHLAVARAARDALRLDRVLFAPVGAQPLKPEGSSAPFADRVAMTELAIADEPGFEISLADAPNSGGRPNYTLETLRQLRAGLPSHGCLFCMMGADSFAGLRRWRGAAQIPFPASLVVASRPGQQLDDLVQFLPRGLTFEPRDSAIRSEYAAVDEPNDLHQASFAVPMASPSPIELRSYRIRNPAGEIAAFYVLPDLDVEISASDIRLQIRSSSEQAAVSQSLPAPVAAYIRTHGLYR